MNWTRECVTWLKIYEICGLSPIPSRLPYYWELHKALDTTVQYIWDLQEYIYFSPKIVLLVKSHIRCQSGTIDKLEDACRANFLLFGTCRFEHFTLHLPEALEGFEVQFHVVEDIGHPEQNEETFLAHPGFSWSARAAQAMRVDTGI